MERSDDIAAIAVALGCAFDLADVVMGQSRVALFPVPTTLARQGDVADGDWLILDGTVSCIVVSPEGRETTLTTYLPGDLVGGFGRDSAPLAASLLTGPATRLLVMRATAIHKLAQSDARFALIIGRAYAQLATKLLDRLAQRISLTAPGRIYARLLELADDSHVIRPPPVIAALAISVQTSRETASRAMSRLERRGVVVRTQDSLTIQSVRLLEELIV